MKDARLDTNVCAYVAAGVYHYLIATGDVDVARAMWPMVERAIDFVVRYQRDDGTISWSLDATGRVESYALLTGSSSIFHSLRCAVALAERLDCIDPRGSWPRVDWATRWRITPRRSRPRTSSPWTGTTRSSAGALVGEARARAARRRLGPPT